MTGAPSFTPTACHGHRIERLEYIFLRPLPRVTEYELRRAMGLAGKRPARPSLLRQMDRLAAQRLPMAQPRLVLGLGRVEEIAALLPIQTTIQRYLAGAEHAAMLAGTAGLPPAASGDDPLMDFVDNAVSITLVRKLFVWAREYLKQRWGEWETGEPLLPGNCGLPLQIQCALLSNLPLSEIEVRYEAERELLMPLASVSGLIGIGRYQPVDGVSCLRCPSQNCPLRECDFDPQKFQDLAWYCSSPARESEKDSLRKSN